MPGHEQGQTASKCSCASYPVHQAADIGHVQRAIALHWRSTMDATCSTIAEMTKHASPINGTADIENNTKNQPVTDLTLGAFDDFMEQVRLGLRSALAVQQTYSKLLANKQALVDQLNKLKVPDLKKRVYGYVRDVRKASLVGEAYDCMVMSLTLSKSVSWTHSFDKAEVESPRDRAIRLAIESLTDDDVSIYAAKIAQARAEREAQLEGLANPQTLSEFRNAIRYRGTTWMTSEILARYDSLEADDARAKRAADHSARLEVKVASQITGATVTPSRHAKKGIDIFVVQLTDRVERNAYEQLVHSARKLGGYYSSYRGGGAIPGFVFEAREQADAFAALVSGNADAAQEQANERADAFADDRSQSTVERLRTMADRIEERATALANRDRKVNTHRRANIASQIEARCAREIAFAVTMRQMADAVETGKAPYLDGVRTMIGLETLLSMFDRAKSAWVNAQQAKFDSTEGEMSRWERHQLYESLWKQPISLEMIDHVRFPTFNTHRSDAMRFGRRLAQIDGSKLVGNRLIRTVESQKEYHESVKQDPLRFALRLSTGEPAAFKSKREAEAVLARSQVDSEFVDLVEVPKASAPSKLPYWVVFSASAAEERKLWSDPDSPITLKAKDVEEALTKAHAFNRATSGQAQINVPYYLESILDARRRLQAAGIDSGCMLRAALRQLHGLRAEVAKPDRVKQLERALTGQKAVGIDFFPTPTAVAQELVAMAGLTPVLLEAKPNLKVYEPHGGAGHIADAIREVGFEPVVSEISCTLRELLEAKGYTLIGHDFLEVTEKFDVIVANPPFCDGADIVHTRHAVSLLNPGGTLVTIVGEGAFARSDAKATAFREWLDELGADVEKLPEGTFLDPALPVTTGANARVVRIHV